MDVVRVSFKIILIPNQMLPKSWLEDTTLSLVSPTRRNGFFRVAHTQPRFCELLLDPPLTRVVSISMRQYPHSVEMIRKEDYCANRKWPTLVALNQKVAEDTTGVIATQKRFSSISHHREEVCRALHTKTSEVRHRDSRSSTQRHSPTYKTRKTSIKIHELVGIKAQ